MRCNEAGLGIIRKYEGLSLKAYRCPAGRWTIGYGHTGTDVKAGSVITEETAERLLAQDVESAERGLKRILKTELNDNQWSALTSLVFNVGPTRLLGTRTLDFINRRRFLDAADALRSWNKAMVDGTLKPLSGLTKRREAERELFLRPVPVK